MLFGVMTWRRIRFEKNVIETINKQRILVQTTHGKNAFGRGKNGNI